MSERTDKERQEAAIIATCEWIREDQRRALIPSELIHERRRAREQG